MQKGDIFSEQNFKLRLKSSVHIEINFLKSAFSQTLFAKKLAFFLETPILRRPEYGLITIHISTLHCTN